MQTPDTPLPTEGRTFYFGGDRHALDDAPCAHCAADYPAACRRVGCVGRLHAARIRVGVVAYVLTCCEHCLLPELEQRGGGYRGMDTPPRG